jgi:nicotinamidase-related amidase
MNPRTVIAVLTAAIATVAMGALPTARAANIIDEWASVKVPPAPELKPVTIDAKTTALLMLDFNTQNCGRRPRCMSSIPAVKQLLTEARAKNVAVVYSIGSTGTMADILKDVAPAANEPWVQANVDKFAKTDLEKILKDKNIQTVIVVGVAAHGAVLYTGSGAAVRGMKVIVPVDGMSAEATFFELSTAWLFANGPGFGSRVTLTKIDLIKF